MEVHVAILCYALKKQVGCFNHRVVRPYQFDLFILEYGDSTFSKIYKRKLFDDVPINRVRCSAAVKRGQTTLVPSTVVSAKATDTFGHS